jgi:hypothetical protein
LAATSAKLVVDDDAPVFCPFHHPIAHPTQLVTSNYRLRA